MKSLRITHPAALLSLGLLAGCSTFAASRYSVNVDTGVALKQFAGRTVSVGSFTSSQPGLSEIDRRTVGPIKTPDGEPFSDFIRKGLVDEMKVTGIYSDNSPVVLTNVDFGTVSGT
jgi:hypothetical protein